MDDIEKAVEEAIKDSEKGTPEIDPTADAEVVKEQILKAQAFAKQAIARAKKAEAEARELKVKVSEHKPEVKPEEKPLDKKGSVLDIEEKVELRMQGYSKEAVSFIESNGGMKALENPYVKKAVDLMVEQARAEKGIPDADSGKSEIEKKYTREQLVNMPAEELYKILPKSNR